MQRNFLRGLLICVVPIALFGAAAAFGTYRPGIDLAGGTILVYEIDLTKQSPTADGSDTRDGLSTEQMQRLAESLKRRIDPADTKNIIIRPLGSTRIEILVPFTPTKKKEAANEDFVQFVKDVVSRVGRLEFRILANEVDDADGVRDAQEKINGWPPEDAAKAAELGKAPPPPDRSDYVVNVNEISAEKVQYEWIELGREERESLGLTNKQAATSSLGLELAANRGKVVRHVIGGGENKAERGTMFIYSRKFTKGNPDPDEKGKDVEYFVLTRVSSSDRVEVGGEITLNATGENVTGKWQVGFRFNGAGDAKFGAMTSRNRPSPGKTVRHLAILLDNRIMSAPGLQSAITGGGRITGNFTKETVDRLVYILRSGALTAALKPNPVSENTVDATLGKDTIRKGLFSIVASFGAVMAFMAIYYRFAGTVACFALLINLLLTIGFMVMVNAAFTLAGLAGIVLMLGMAVDANVLIYERLREEREKGATLAAALRAGYDRALPTILDTHITSIFTAIVLFIFGNDNLRGFAVSLTVGLIISLFTSLYVTRLIFDFWLHRRWTKELKFMLLFKRPNFDFMAIRQLMFTLTAILTVVGLGVFLYRGERGLNVDFRGGTVYGGRLAESKSLSELLDLLAEARQASKLQVESVREVKTEGKSGDNTWEIQYQGESKPVFVTFANAPANDADVKTRASALPDVSIEQVKVSTLGDDALGSGISKSFTIRTTEKEKELVQVMLDRLLRTESGTAMLDAAKLDSWTTNDTTITLKFSKPASVAYVQSLAKRVFRTKGREPQAGTAFTLVGVASTAGSGEYVDEQNTGKFATMQLDVSPNSEFSALKESVENRKLASKPGVLALAGALPLAGAESAKGRDEATDLNAIIQELKSTFEARPVPERLETFDAALAQETQSRALFAIIASWIAILLYLWARFGSWTFGLAAVLCLIHDLCFTLGAIAFCHYLHAVPGLGSFLLLQDFKIDLAAVAALLTLVGYSVNDTIVVFDRIREVRGKNPLLTEQMINDSVNQTLSRTVLASLTVFLVVGVLYIFGGEGVHLFSFVMVVGVVVGTYSSIYIASPLLLFFGEGQPKTTETTTSAVAKV